MLGVLSGLDFSKLFWKLVNNVVYLCFTVSESLAFVADISLGGIYMASTRDLNFTRLPLENVTSPVAVDYDPVAQIVFWTDVGRNTINAARVDGTNQRVLANGLSGTSSVTLYTLLQMVISSGTNYETEHSIYLMLK